MMDPYRLPQHAIPTRYELRLEPDLASSRFTGTATIALAMREAATELVLNAVELVVGDVSIEDKTGTRVEGSVELDEATERCRIRFPRQLEPGAWRLNLAFQGILNDKLRGFYRSQYKDKDGVSHFMAATQFEATDARRAFPCWDEPAFKAVFAVTLVIEPGLTAVSNTAVQSERTENGKKVVCFKDSIKMSTYLVAFIVGLIEPTSPVLVGRTPLRVWAVPGKGHLTAFGQRIGAYSLSFFENYYGLPYPGDKLDLLAIPDFAAGAMENLGAITFRENALLVDEGASTLAECERVADVVAHENAHMWFGDLVTMSWWNGLWLNEAFATFMEMLAVDAWKPEWKRWEGFGASRGSAMAVDGLHSTRPIEYEVRAPKDADAMFDSLTYEKGAGVLRMLEQHLGPEVFREGIRGFLRKHAYGNADTRDLWVALEQAANQAVPDLMDGWIFRSGYPLITAARDPRGHLVLSQQRFTYLSAAESGMKNGEAGADPAQRWHVPIQLKITADGQARTQRVLMTEQDMPIPVPAGFESVLVNEGGHGFYRVRYQGDLLERLLVAPEGLSAIERFNLVSDIWAATVAGLIPIADYLDVTTRFRGIRDRNVWGVLIDSFQVLNRVVDSADRPMMETLVRDRVSISAGELGWAPREEEIELTRQLRGDLLRAMGSLGNDPAVQSRAAELYVQHRRIGARTQLDPNVLAAIVNVLAHCGEAERYEEFLTAFRSANSPQEERRYLFALAAFRQAELHDRTLNATLSGDIRTQDGPFIIHSMLLNVYARERAWAFVKSNWDALDRTLPRNGLRRLCGGIVGLVSSDLERDVRQFFADRKIDFGGKILPQYLEQLRIAVRMRERDGTALRHYLSNSPN